MPRAQGPLKGIKIIELGSVGPLPYCSVLLSDLGAEIIRIDRLAASDGGQPTAPEFNLLNRGRRSIAMDLKKPEAVAAVLRMVEDADAILEGFRPGVTERLGLGPETCLKANPKIVYGRMTGWGQTGPLAQEPGHDINYISLTGVLNAVGRAGEPPAIPLNLAGDFGGGSLFLALGVLSALIETGRTGKGQVVDAAMVDGSASLMTLFYGMMAANYWTDERGVNRLDSGAPWYNVYEAADGKYVSIGANEARFFRNAVKVLGLEGANLPAQHDKTGWPQMKAMFAEAFRQKTRDEWAEIAMGKETCITPVLSLSEAPEHPHLKARGTYTQVSGVLQPAPAPRFSDTPGNIQGPPTGLGTHTEEILIECGFTTQDITALRTAGAIHVE